MNDVLRLDGLSLSPLGVADEAQRLVPDELEALLEPRADASDGG